MARKREPPAPVVAEPFDGALPGGMLQGLALRALDVTKATLNQARADGWLNAIMGFGAADVDKTSNTVYDPSSVLLDMPTLSSMYLNEDMSAKIVDVYPRDALREGFEIGGIGDPNDAAESQAINASLTRGDWSDAAARWAKRRGRRLQRRADAVEVEAITARYLKPWAVRQTVLKGLIWGRLYGKAAIWLGSRTADPETPFMLGERIDFLRVIDRRYLWPIYGSADYFDDAGQPLIYNITSPNPQGLPRAPSTYQGYVPRIHASRLVLFSGALTDDLTRTQLAYSDASVLQRCYDALRSDGLVWKSAEHLMAEASIGTLKIKNLFALTAAGMMSQLAARLQIHNMSRSVAKTLLLDADKEDYTRQSQTFAGIPDLTDRARQRVAAAAEIPVTRLQGESPSGLNATGDGDLRWYLMSVHGYRMDRVEPPLLQLLRALFAQPDSPIRDRLDDITIVWPPLWTPSAPEAADIRLKNSQADQIDIANGVLLPAEASLSHYGDDGYSQEIRIDRELRLTDMMPPPPGTEPDPTEADTKPKRSDGALESE